MRLTRLALVSSLALAVTLVGCPATSPGPDGGTPDSGVPDGGQQVTPAFTVHYHRPASDYTGWKVTPSAGAVESSASQGGTDGWGATYPLTVASGAGTLTFTLASGGASEAAAFSVDVSGSVREVWVISGFKTPITVRPPAIPGAAQVAVYYKRTDTSYAGWGLHVWGDQVVGTAWTSPIQQVGVSDVLGAGFLVDTPKGQPATNCPVGDVCLIVHQGDTKDPGPDMNFDPKALGDIVFVTSGSSTITAAPPAPGAVQIVGASAHLLRRNVVAWNLGLDAGATSYELRWSPVADIVAAGTGVDGGQSIPLQAVGALDSAIAQQVPHLSAFTEYTLDAGDLSTIKAALKGQLVAVAHNASGGVVAATAVQTGFGLDDLFATDVPLGPTFDGGAPTLALWAPTAQSVVLNLFDASKTAIGQPIQLTEGAQGVWSISGPISWVGDYYQYQVTVFHPASNAVQTFTVTDPYSVNLSTNGVYSQIVDLSAPSLQPPGWTTFVKPALAAPEDIVVYEGHVRDFSVFDATVPADRVGKFLAFANDGGALTAGQQHLQALAQAGLTHLHVLPAFDIATVDEDPANRVDIGQPFSALCAKNSAVPAALCSQFAGRTILEAYQQLTQADGGGSDQQQLIASYLSGLDAFNWGYDPFHYGAVEGSYASTAEGTAKILEFRQMVMGLSTLGLRTVMDVVYNHTNASGPTSPKSVLDKVVPGYYHRLDSITGAVQSASCCADTATERRMMERLMIDTLVRWARDYKVDGFRFDLMGLHLRSNIEHAKAALAALTLSNDGVDGSKIYLYGEGWSEADFKTHGVTADQVSMGGAGVGTFNDRLRDAVRGGGPFDNGSALRANQGFSNGLYFDPNELSAATSTQLASLLSTSDWIRTGMAGNLADFRYQASDGTVKSGSSPDYHGAPVGYTQDPQESINYVSAHDNQTLWDIVAYKLPTGTPSATRVRAYDVALDTVLLGQGVPFFHLGDDILRSKSMDKNSFDSGDWFNQVDWSGQHNGWAIGLPSAGNDSANWSVIQPLFSDATAAVSPTDIATASTHFKEMLKVRKSSPLFRLQTKADVMSRVDFVNTGTGQIPGVIAMTITDGACGGADLDPARDAVVVILNADKVQHVITVPGASGFQLHALLQASADPVVRTASASGTSFTVPARTTAVFEQLQGGSRGAGLPCNTK
jgi:pullulanase